MGTWRFDNHYEYNCASRTWESFLANYPTCTRDNILIINADGTYREEEGATKCIEANPQIISQGTWALLNENTRYVIHQVGAQTSDTVNVLELSSTVFMNEPPANCATDTSGGNVHSGFRGRWVRQ